MGCKINFLLTELLQQFGAGAGQLHADALDAVAQLGRHGLDDGDGAVVVQVDLRYAHRSVIDVKKRACIVRRRGRGRSKGSNDEYLLPSGLTLNTTL